METALQAQARRHREAQARLAAEGMSVSATGGIVWERQPSPCGTRGAFLRHKRAGEKPCEACYAANRAYDRERYARRAGRPIRRWTRSKP